MARGKLGKTGKINVDENAFMNRAVDAPWGAGPRAASTRRITASAGEIDFQHKCSGRNPTALFAASAKDLLIRIR
jgi:hypothetical protein